MNEGTTMFKKPNAAPIAAPAVLVITLTQALPALAAGLPKSSTSPGTGTLGAIFGWLLQLFS
jgi:hypothetical protein